MLLFVALCLFVWLVVCSVLLLFSAAVVVGVVAVVVVVVVAAVAAVADLVSLRKRRAIIHNGKLTVMTGKSFNLFIASWFHC